MRRQRTGGSRSLDNRRAENRLGGCKQLRHADRDRQEPTLSGIPKEVQDALKEWVSAGWTRMRRRVTPSDVANVCALLCSVEASFLTGQTIVVDGGSWLMNPDFPLALQVPK